MKCPQTCPKCLHSLADPDVPAELAQYRDQFTLGLMKARDGRIRTWLCPFCKGTFQR